jgi:hypothetical protein
MPPSVNLMTALCEQGPRSLLLVSAFAPLSMKKKYSIPKRAWPLRRSMDTPWAPYRGFLLLFVLGPEKAEDNGAKRKARVGAMSERECVCVCGCVAVWAALFQL